MRQHAVPARAEEKLVETRSFPAGCSSRTPRNSADNGALIPHIRRRGPRARKWVSKTVGR